MVAYFSLTKTSYSPKVGGAENQSEDGSDEANPLGHTQPSVSHRFDVTQYSVSEAFDEDFFHFIKYQNL